MILTVGELKKELAQFPDECEVMFQSVVADDGDFIYVEFGGLKSSGDMCVFKWA